MVLHFFILVPGNSSLTTTPRNQTRGEILMCSDGFFFDENVTNLCRPTCGEFNPTSIGIQIVHRGAISISFIASVLMFILALAVQRETWKGLDPTTLHACII